MTTKIDNTPMYCLSLWSQENKDRQYIGVEGDLSDPTALDQRLRNAAETAAKGAEVEMTWVATDNLQFDVAYGYIDFEINSMRDKIVKSKAVIALYSMHK